MTRIIRFLPALLLVALCACGGGNQGSGNGAANPSEEGILADEPSSEPEVTTAEIRPFPLVSVPMVYADNEESQTEYVMEHFWDPFFAGHGATGNNMILGVSDEEIEQALANYISILQNHKADATPDNPAALTKAQKSIKTLFSKMESRPGAAFARMAELVTKYLYDPNSPLRDEDLYLPFAEAAEKSSCTSEDMRVAYQTEAKACRTNAFGQKVPDIKYSDARGRKGNLYGVKADYTMLFFSNPGCTACKEIVNEIVANGYPERLISAGKLAIVNIYIDEEVNKWREYLPNYPSSWINGYDYTFQLRGSGTYDIRAIPSLYLLDSQKRVLMKDAPTERVLSYLNRI